MCLYYMFQFFRFVSLKKYDGNSNCWITNRQPGSPFKVFIFYNVPKALYRPLKYQAQRTKKNLYNLGTESDTYYKKKNLLRL